MQVRIGYRTQTYGTVETGSTGLEIHSNTPEDHQKLTDIIDRLRRYYPDSDDAEFIALLPRALSGGYVWAHDTTYDTDASTPITRAASSEPDPAPDYPNEVLRYGDAGKALYDEQVAALVGIDVPHDEARADVLALWDTLVKATSLQPRND